MCGRDVVVVPHLEVAAAMVAIATHIFTSITAVAQESDLESTNGRKRSERWTDY